MAALPVIPSSAPAGRGGELSESQRAEVARRLASAVEGEVRFDLHNRMLYATDASLYQVEPIGVVIPASVEDAARAVEFCAREGLAILPRGGGTSLAGQCTNRAVVIDFSANCRRVLEVDAPGRRCRVEPGITVDDLNERLAGAGLFFAPDPATSRQANIGGCIGNNAAGARSIRYGRTSENLNAVVVCLADGARVRLEAGSRDLRVREMTLRVAEIVQRNAGLIRERFAKTIRRNAGYNLDLVLNQMESAGPRADSDQIVDAINLAHLVCGSEGTLAVTLGADLKLHPVPKAKGLAVVGFASVDEAIAAVGPILATGPSAVELLDDLLIGLAKDNVEYRKYVELLPSPGGRVPAAVLYVEYFEDRAAEQQSSRAADSNRGLSSPTLGEQFAALRGVVGGRPVVAMTDSGAMGKLWKLRKAGEPLLHGMPGSRKPLTFIEDNAVPVERLGEFVTELRKIVEAHGTRAAFWAHASVGVLHVRPLLDIRDPADERRMHEIAVLTADLARSLGGVMSGEHGDGRVRGPLLERFYGPEIMRAFREVKAVFDPRGLLNPGNIVEPGPVASISESTRVKPRGRLVNEPEANTFFDFSDQHGLSGASEMCNGAGVCRKKTGGTMCPSYMATLDERHSTRGRGNALRLAITGQFEPETVRRGDGETVRAAAAPMWDDPGTIETLDLCLSCKACKAECPSNVDIARLKAEYTAQRFAAAGEAPLAARVFGNVRVLNRLGAMAPGIANWMGRRGIVRAVMNRVLGLAGERSLLEFGRALNREWRQEDRAAEQQSSRAADEGRGSAGADAEAALGTGGRAASGTGEAPVVVLFGDCFTMYNEPRIGMAARRVLEAFGYEVVLFHGGCCGRAMISNGLLPEAIETIDETIARLREKMEDPRIAGRLRAIVACEPSCLSAIKDDWIQLKLRNGLDLRRRIKDRAWLVEEFLDLFWDQHPRRPALRASGAVVLHGHCHQKALWGNESSAGLLRRLGHHPSKATGGGTVTVLDSGCCGMAGSFGFTRERYGLSMKIGELVLFPAVRGGGDAAVVAPGTSCRHQILDGTGVRAVHPIEVVARAVLQ
jgi:FAD/FMN-containing dehydrogenase/Fe-S oxidoreductase